MDFDLKALRKPVPLPIAAKLKKEKIAVAALAQMIGVSSDYLSRVLNGHCHGGALVRQSLKALEEQLG